MKKIIISNKIKSNCPELVLASIECNAVNNGFSPLLWKETEELIKNIKNNYQIENINKIPAIAATRNAYKILGKDPNRYRPSAEALLRRIIREMDLHKVNTIVDIINYVSIKTAYSIGGFDADKIQGDELLLDIGTAKDNFEAIGRGKLNIEFLPVYRDTVSAIGSPTSDEERTKIDIGTKNILIVINAYSGEKGLSIAVDLMKDMLEKYSDANNFKIWRSNE
ncbi:MAG: hypothetical protein LBP67_02380 [Bacteroidales bacterium]|jgi:DNA/RNA-binding domain of Phe-tRNA-synthetase-like protein|nr:hypothetical protein [Bacteroidales bacterium]